MIETLGDRLEFFQSCLSHPYQIPKNYNIVNIHVLFMPTLGDKMKLTEDALELIHRGRISFDERERRYKFGQSMINLHEVLQTPIEGNIHHYVIDPKEIDVQSITKKPVKKHFFHPLQGEDVIVNRFMLYDFSEGLSRRGSGWKKTEDWTMGLTAFNDLRKSYHEKLLPLGMEKNWNYFWKTGDVDTRLPYGEYQELIKKSKTTLILPAYDTDSFSFKRFVEALSVGTLPIIFGDQFRRCFQSEDLLQTIEKHLLISDLGEMKSRVDYLIRNYDEIINELFNHKELKELGYESHYRKPFEEHVK